MQDPEKTIEINTPTAVFHRKNKAPIQLNEKYKLFEQIDKGGMGYIYRATQLALNRDVAIKIINAPDDHESIGRFLQEAAVTAQLKHPNTIRIFDFGQTDQGKMFLVMELLHGLSLKKHLAKNGPMKLLEAIDVAIQITSALSEAHHKNIIHRDVKPSNIFLTQQENIGQIAKLIDFGLVKHLNKKSEFSLSGMVLGSPMYMSPEQVQNQKLSERSDIYSLGLCLYSMVTGKPPYRSKKIPEILRLQVNADPIPASSLNPKLKESSCLNWVIQTACQKDPTQRFQSANQLLAALEIAKEALLEDLDTTLSLKDGVLAFADGTVIVDGLDGSTSGSSYKSLRQRTSLREKVKFLNQRSNVFLGIIALLLSVLVAMLFFSNQTESFTVVVSSNPAQANVYIDSQLVGTTPFEYHLQKGQNQRIELRAAGFQTQEIMLTPMSPKPLILLKKQQGK